MGLGQAAQHSLEGGSPKPVAVAEVNSFYLAFTARPVGAKKPPFVPESLGVSCPCVLTQEANIYKTENNMYNSELGENRRFSCQLTRKKRKHSSAVKALYRVRKYSSCSQLWECCLAIRAWCPKSEFLKLAAHVHLGSIQMHRNDIDINCKNTKGMNTI